MLGAEFTREQAEPWMDDALCAQVGTEMFFPEKGGSTRDAKRLCATCPVAVQCLDFALRTDERFGIWGGLSERERRSVRKGRPVALSPAQQRGAMLRKLHADGLMDTEMASVFGVSPEVVGRERRALGLPSNSSGGYRTSGVKADPRSRAKEEVPMSEVTSSPRPTPPTFRPEELVRPVEAGEVVGAERPAKWSVRKVWVAIAPDGTMHGPFEDQGASLGFVGRQLRPAVAVKSEVVPAGGKREYRRTTPEEIARIRDMTAEGKGPAEIARELGLKLTTVTQVRKRLAVSV